MIVHATDFFAPRVGGIETQVAELARAQVAAGEDVHVVTTTPLSRSAATDFWPFPVHRIGMSIRFASAVRPFAGPGIRRVLDDLNPDVVHAHVSVVSPCAWYAVQWALRRQRPVVASVHSLWDGYRGVLYWAMDRSTGWCSQALVAPVSNVTATLVRRAVPAADMAVVPNGVDPRQWRGTGHTSRMDDIHVVSVGRLVGRRQPMVLLDVLRAARARVGPQLRATIAGSGPAGPKMAAYLQRYAMTSWVRLAGPMDRAGVRALLADADIYVNAATRESFGIAALEARTAGVPVVALADTGTADFVRHEHEGLLCHDAAALADGVARLANDHELRQRIAAHNRAYTPACTWPNVLAAFDNCYARVQDRTGTTQGRQPSSRLTKRTGVVTG